MLPTTHTPAISEAFAFCERMLPHVSRTFALTIPVLNEPLRTQVGVSYLLCRIIDTVEDRPGIPDEERATLLSLAARAVENPEDESALQGFLQRWPRHPDRHHQELIERTKDVVRCHRSFPDTVRNANVTCINEMASGMAQFPAPGTEDKPLQACADLTELERYCHFVAGTVGNLLSRLFALELPPGWMSPQRLEQGRRFGLGLQLVNVLKDYQGDWERGISFIPMRWIHSDRQPVRLKREGAEILVRRALEHLDAAHAYILSLPAARADMRAFCLLAGRLAMATLRVIGEKSDHSAPLKVDREEVWQILNEVESTAADDTALRALNQRDRKAVLSTLNI